MTSLDGSAGCVGHAVSPKRIDYDLKKVIIAICGHCSDVNGLYNHFDDVASTRGISSSAAL